MRRSQEEGWSYARLNRIADAAAEGRSCTARCRVRCSISLVDEGGAK
jgi:hypothetical protein